jgi:catechol 2,3-dioxygenase-like lactoylglutathione lyase family enzyme
MAMGAPVPVLRMFDEAKAREFYCDFLGFTVDWEHRFEPDTPLYMQIRNGSCVIQLSEHFGDASPGASMRIPMPELDEFVAELNAKRYRNARPGIMEQPWARDCVISDPFGNKLIFWAPHPTELQV